MIKRTTIEIDDKLLERAKRALGEPTNRATIETALRHVADKAESEFHERAERQRRYFESLAEHADLDVLASDEMWR